MCRTKLAIYDPRRLPDQPSLTAALSSKPICALPTLLANINSPFPNMPPQPSIQIPHTHITLLHPPIPTSPNLRRAAPRARRPSPPTIINPYKRPRRPSTSQFMNKCLIPLTSRTLLVRHPNDIEHHIQPHRLACLVLEAPHAVRLGVPEGADGRVHAALGGAW